MTQLSTLTDAFETLGIMAVMKIKQKTKSISHAFASQSAQLSGQGDFFPIQ